MLKIQSIDGDPTYFRPYCITVKNLQILWEESITTALGYILDMNTFFVHDIMDQLGYINEELSKKL